MSSNSWKQALFCQGVDGTALTNTTTPGSVLAGESKITIPSGLLLPRTKLRVFASGRLSTAASTPGTLTFDFRLGAVIAFNGGASPTLAVSASNLTWRLEMELICRSIGNGTSATLIGTGVLHSAALSAATPIQLLPASSPAVGTGFDSTAGQIADLFATFSVANAANSIRCDLFEFELSN